MKIRVKCMHLPELCFSSVQLEVWISQSIIKHQAVDNSVMLSLSHTWWSSFDSVEYIEYFYPVEQIIPQSSAGGSGLECRKVFLISCPNDSIAPYTK